MKVRAIKFGFYHHKREPGDVFEFEGKPSEVWMEPVDDAARAAFKKAGFKFALKPAPLPANAGGKSSAAGSTQDPGAGAAGGSTGDANVI
jgi:hypothetical protein